eukprot:CAMPEP_0194288808 /NCGR_PEP_ID=MMETSP0169-20130528/37646_1 /TAXON_ID=218684 /ORGANISM="Corethron pennatum, Strain L29A3" /LENGTH=758 /DNA_ID=CAMNT_0039035909 /DNA_START=443 /DNA_END=2719 /DNA_ORIENTATION=+
MPFLPKKSRHKKGKLSEPDRQEDDAAPLPRLSAVLGSLFLPTAEAEQQQPPQPPPPLQQQDYARNKARGLLKRMTRRPWKKGDTLLGPECEDRSPYVKATSTAPPRYPVAISMSNFYEDVAYLRTTLLGLVSCGPVDGRVDDTFATLNTTADGHDDDDDDDDDARPSFACGWTLRPPAATRAHVPDGPRRGGSPGHLAAPTVAVEGVALSDRSHVTVDGLPVAVADLRRLLDQEARRAQDGRPSEKSLLDEEEEVEEETETRPKPRGPVPSSNVISGVSMNIAPKKKGWIVQKWRKKMQKKRIHQKSKPKINRQNNDKTRTMSRGPQRDQKGNDAVGIQKKEGPPAISIVSGLSMDTALQDRVNFFKLGPLGRAASDPITTTAPVPGPTAPARLATAPPEPTVLARLATAPLAQANWLVAIHDKYILGQSFDDGETDSTGPPPAPQSPPPISAHTAPPDDETQIYYVPKARSPARPSASAASPSARSGHRGRTSAAHGGFTTLTPSRSFASVSVSAKSAASTGNGSRLTALHDKYVLGRSFDEGKTESTWPPPTSPSPPSLFAHAPSHEDDSGGELYYVPEARSPVRPSGGESASGSSGVSPPTRSRQSGRTAVSDSGRMTSSCSSASASGSDGSTLFTLNRSKPRAGIAAVSPNTVTGASQKMGGGEEHWRDFKAVPMYNGDDDDVSIVLQKCNDAGHIISNDEDMLESVSRWSVDVPLQKCNEPRHIISNDEKTLESVSHWSGGVPQRQGSDSFCQ